MLQESWRAPATHKKNGRTDFGRFWIHRSSRDRSSRSAPFCFRRASCLIHYQVGGRPTKRPAVSHAHDPQGCRVRSDDRGSLGYHGDVHRIPESPEVPLEFSDNTDPSRIQPATPLTGLCAPRAIPALAELLAMTFSPKGAIPVGDQHRHNLVRQVNAFARLEANLWDMAWEGGLPNPAPYAVRRGLARWLWRPEVPGTILCLRCAEPVSYERSPKTATPRDGRCRLCARGQPDDWPDHAIAPNRRGDWWLSCQRPNAPSPLLVAPRRASAPSTEATA